MLEERIEAGALFGASLILGAWLDAGSPDPQQWKSRLTSSPDEAAPQKVFPKESDVDRPGHFVASRTSNIFHRADCPHVNRIKPGNRVSFQQLKEAQATGRSPCKLCKPVE